MSKTVASTLAFLNSASTLSIAGVNRLNESVLDEASSRHLKKTIEADGIVAKIYKDTEWQEYVVRFFDSYGKEFADADYHTDEFNDAVGTAQAQMQQLAKANNVDESQEDFFQNKDLPADQQLAAPPKEVNLESQEETVTYSAFDKSGPAVQEMVQLSATTQEEAIAEAKVLGKERGWKVVGVKASKWSTDLDEQKGGRSYTVHARTADGKTAEEVVSGSFSFGAYDAAKKYAEKNLSGYEVIPGGTTYNDGRKFEAVNHAEGMGADVWVKETDNIDEGIGDMVAGIKGGLGAIGSGIAAGAKKVADTYSNGRDTNIINKNQAKIDAIKAKMDARNGTQQPAPQNQPAPNQQQTQQPAPTSPQQQVVQSDAIKLLSSLSSNGKLEMKTAREILKLAARLQAQGI